MRIFLVLFALMLCLHCTAESNTAPELHLTYFIVKDELTELTVIDKSNDIANQEFLGEIQFIMARILINLIVYPDEVSSEER